MKYKSVLFSCLLGCVGAISTQVAAGGSVGGDCCADLEERVAELEATTVRKGNRKISLNISGNVHRALLFTDSDKNAKYDKDVLITDTESYQSKIRFVGIGSISRDVYVGVRIDLGLSDGGKQADGFQQDAAVRMLHNDLLIGSRTFGDLRIGHSNTASDFAGESDLSGTAFIAGGSVGHYNVGANIDGFSRQERIRYDTPAIAGFRLAASWQENKDWDAALSLDRKLGDFKILGKIAYYERGGDVVGRDVYDQVDLTVAEKGDGGVTGSISALHNPTGLSLTFAAGEVDNVGVTDKANIVKDFWYVKAGLQRKIFGIGKTYFSVDYHNMTTGGFGDLQQGNGTEFLEAEVEKWGVQIVQDVDAAAMKVYASYWNAEAQSDPFSLGPILDEQVLMVGVNIDF